MDETMIESLEQQLASDICMNPGIPSCDMCLFNGRNYRSGAPWCTLSERLAKQQLLVVDKFIEVIA